MCVMMISWRDQRMHFNNSGRKNENTNATKQNPTNKKRLTGN
jgi:hypothetical protein